MDQTLCKEIAIIDDDVIEGLEKFTVHLAFIQQVGVQVQLPMATATVKINDDDDSGKVVYT